MKSIKIFLKLGKGDKILVIGGAGFIGSHLCELLYFKGMKVTSLDNYFTGSTSNHIDGVEYINGNSEDIEKLIDFSPKIIFHLGEYSRVEQSFEDIDKVWKYNIVSILNILKFAKNNNSKIIYAGSSTKFGDIGKESSPYAFSKATNTEFVINYSKWFNLDYAITYFYNAYGPREINQGQYATIIAKFLNQAKANQPLTIVKPGTQKRNFTHIEDIVNGIYLVGVSGKGDGYGIGSDKVFSIQEVANLISNNQVFLPSRLGNRNSAELKTSKTISLGWKPKKNLEAYIKKELENKKL